MKYFTTYYFNYLTDIMHVFQQSQNDMVRELSRPKITYRDLTLLREVHRLKQDRGNTTNTVAANLGITPSAVSTSVKQLEQKNYVYRLIDADDRRKIYIELTKRAMELLVAYKARFDNQYQAVLEGLSDADQEILLALTQRFRQALLDTVPQSEQEE